SASSATGSRRKGLSSAASIAPSGPASPACATASARRHKVEFYRQIRSRRNGSPSRRDIGLLFMVRRGSGRTIYLQAPQAPRVQEIHSRRSKATPESVIHRLVEEARRAPDGAILLHQNRMR